MAESAGSHPAVQVNPYAIATLERHGHFWTGGRPRGLDGLTDQDWDFVITVCDRALEKRVKDIGQATAVEPTAGAT